MQGPKDALLNLLELSPFVDFTDRFNKEYNIELVLEQEAQEYVENFARQNGIQISDTLKQLLKGASSLNYMNITGKYNITVGMLKDPIYFDKLFTEWYKQSRSDGPLPDLPQTEQPENKQNDSGKAETGGVE